MTHEAIAGEIALRPPRIDLDQAFTSRLAGEAGMSGMVDILVDLIDDAPVGVALLDVECRLRMVNRHLLSAFGRPGGGHFGRRPSELHPAGEAFEVHAAHVIETRKSLLAQPLLVSDPDTGDDQQWSASFHPLVVDGERLVGVGVVVLDVTAEELSRQRAEQLLRFAGKVGVTTMPDDVATALVQFLSSTFRSRCAVAFVRDDKLHIGAVQGFTTDVRARWTTADLSLERAGPMADAVRTGRIMEVVSPSDFVDAYAALDAERQEVGDASVIAVPLMVHDDDRRQAVGVVRLSWPHPHRLGDSGWTLLRTVVSMAELALSRIATNERNETARVVERVADEQRRLAERERVAVELLQRAALPVRLPGVDGLRIDAVYQPATGSTGIGGDWYDVFRLADDRLGIVIADVAGHGEEAASFMVQVRNMLRAMAMEHDQPHVVLERVNALARSLADFDVPFITCCYALIELPERRLGWAKAGHFDPLRVTASGVAAYAAAPIRPPLTVKVDPRYTTSWLALDPGDRLIFFTDGLIERRGEAIDAGLARLAARASESRACDAAGCLESLLGIVECQFDDLALVCVDVD
jgi:serine phosphatase RsbU (regulator of sigma subunit)